MARPLRCDVAKVLADWKTGKYSERDLASIHKVSSSTIHKLVCGVEKSIESIASKTVAIKQEVAKFNEYEKSRYEQLVDEKSRNIQFYADAGIKIAQSALKSLDEKERPNLFEHKALAETVLRSKEITLGKEVAPAAAIQINNGDTQQAMAANVALDAFRSEVRRLQDEV